MEHADTRGSAAPVAPSDRSTATESRGVAIAVIAMVVGVAFVTRFYAAGNKSLWLDEAWSWRGANLSLPDMLDWTAADVHPPLYYAVLHFTVALAGNSEAVLRFPSVLASTATILVAAVAARRISGTLAAALTGLLLILNATDLRFAQEARMYPLTGFLALASTVALASFITTRRPIALASYVILATALIYTHYLGFVLLALHVPIFVAYGAAEWRASRGRAIWAGGIAACIVIALAYTPWWGSFSATAGGGVGHIPSPNRDFVITTTRDSVAGFGVDPQAALPLTIVLLAAAVFAVARRGREPLVASLATLALTPAVLVAISVLRTPVYDLRRISPFTAPLGVLAAVGIAEAVGLASRLPSSARMTAVALASVSLGIVTVIRLNAVLDWYDSPPREDWRAVAADVRGSDGPVFIYARYASVPLGYYARQGTRVVPVIPSDAALMQRLAAERPGGSATLVLSHEDSAGAALLLDQLGAYYTVGQPSQYWGGIKLRQLRSREPAPTGSAQPALPAGE